MARNTYEIDETLDTPFNIRHLFRASSYIKKYAKRMIGALILSAASAVVALMSPMIVQIALDDIIPSGDRKTLYFLGIVLFATYAVSIVLATIKARVMGVASQRIIYDIREDLYVHLQKLPFQYYDDRPHGKILIRVVNYVNSVSDMLSNGLINIVLEVINIVLIIIFMLKMDVRLSLVILAGVPFLAFFMRYIKRKLRQAWQQVSNKNSNLNAYLQENITGAKVAQIFAREDENERIFETLSNNCRTTWKKAVTYSNLVWPGIDNISVCIRGAIYLVGILVLGPKEVSIGVIVAMTSYASRFWQPIMNLGNIFNNFINNIAYLERIFETIDEKVDVDDAEDAAELDTVKGEVEFKNVCFSYEEGKEVLHNVSFQVKAGENIALVGPTGAGKSTIVNLISRFYNVDSGEVLIDGQDISKVTLRSLRSQMGIMLQDSFIFSGTIEENIRYGKLDATMEEIAAASRVVRADEFIRNMPDGYQSEVKERGNILSQGQKQLISFARTIISDPRILVLDEATSSIDVKTERDLQEGLNAMLRGRTAFIIAHRLSTIKSCDRIMYVSDGGIIEAGTHAELMKKKGAYYRLYMSQIQDIA